LRNTTLFDRTTPFHRIAVIAGVVVLLHVAALWAVQSGLLRRAAKVVVPVQVIRAVVVPVTSVAPQVLPVKPISVKPPVKPVRPTATPPAASPVAPRPPALQPLAVADAPPTPPTPVAPTGVQAQQTAPSLAPMAAATSTAATQAAPAQSKVELPSTVADYLNNPKPRYPLLSKRAGEQGRVLVHVLIGADGLAQQADVKTSSGFERLDQAALATVLRWRYVPGRRGGVAEAMWFNVPINFVLEQ
jgi:protein TonB